MRLPEKLRAFGVPGVGLIGVLGAIACTLEAPRAGLTGWLGAAVMLQGIPVGGLILLAMMPLMKGQWEAQLRGSCEAAIGLWTFAIAAFVPVLLGIGAIYSWMSAAPETAFQRFWLSPVPFVLRTAAWFVALGVIARALVGGRASRGICALALVVLVLGGSLMAVDWLMSLDVDFHSSGFGLQVLALQTCSAYATILLVRLVSRPEPGDQRFGSVGGTPGLLGALLLVFLLLWLYFQFMPYLITWSGNLPEGAHWYAIRSTGAWPWLLALAGALGGLPLAALLFSQVRRSPLALALASISVLTGKAIEFAWLVVPGRGAVAGLSFGCSAIALGAFALFYLAPATARWPQCRRCGRA
ncbi:hypothetical protein WBP07_20570 (plasmid) [Novosphingobium sp. BL-8A]|uniref:hypothetical protein n=1 Tax=Novosphingobium sp. BL-8A TaxID=3127639 RepID=UPI00375770E7